MKSEVLCSLAVAGLFVLSSCSKSGEIIPRIPSIELKSANSVEDGIKMIGRCSSYGVSGCEYFFLCAYGRNDFSNAIRISARQIDSGDHYDAIYKPSGNGTFYCRFCADNRGLSYIESEEKVVRYNVSQHIPEAIDLGLSVKWASFNLGASKPEENGGFYQWAGLEDVTDTSINLDWDYCPFHIGIDKEAGWSKYSTDSVPLWWSGPGNPDNKVVLDPEDDASSVLLEGKWRTPTNAEWIELKENCTWTWTDNYNSSGVAGQIISSRKPGYTEKSIFLPAAGRRFNNTHESGSYGDFWSSSLYTESPYRGYSVYFNSSEIGISRSYRYLGRSIRPVSD